MHLLLYIFKVLEGEGSKIVKTSKIRLRRDITAYIQNTNFLDYVLNELTFNLSCSVIWGCRIHRLHLWSGVRPSPNECLVYDTKQSDAEVPVMLELWGMRSISSLPSTSGQIWPGVVAPDRVVSMGQREVNCVMPNWIAFNGTILTFKLHTNAKLNCLK